MKNVLIAGVDHGIGYALAEKFLTECFIVYGSYYNERPEIFGERFVAFSLDFLSESSINEAARELKNQAGLWYAAFLVSM